MQKTSEILNKLNYMNESKKGGSVTPGILSEIVNDVNRLFVKQVQNGMHDEKSIESYKANQITDTRVFSFNYTGLKETYRALSTSIDAIKNTNNKTKVM